MRKMILLLALIAVMTMGVCSAYADTPAREGMIAYSGTDAFTHLTSEEREACTSWLVYGGEMSDLCKKATMKLIAEAPDAVTAEQRQALTAAASGVTVASQKPKEAPKEEPKAEIKKKDYTGHAIVLGLGILAGLIIHNNTKHHRSAPANPPQPPHPQPHRFSPHPAPTPVSDRRPAVPPRMPGHDHRPPKRQ